MTTFLNKFKMYFMLTGTALVIGYIVFLLYRNKMLGKDKEALTNKLNHFKEKWATLKTINTGNEQELARRERERQEREAQEQAMRDDAKNVHAQALDDYNRYKNGGKGD